MRGKGAWVGGNKETQQDFSLFTLENDSYRLLTRVNLGFLHRGRPSLGGGVFQTFVRDDTFITVSVQFAGLAPPVIVDGEDPHSLSIGDGQFVGKGRRKGAPND